MKKLLLTSFVMVLALYSFGQGISGGVKAGMNLANQKISGSGFSLDTKAKPGLHAGAFFVIMLNEKFGIQPEALFSMQGSKVDVAGNDGKLKFNYITVPVLFRYNITEMISVHAGPQFGILASAKAEEEDGDEEDIKDNFKGIDFGAAGGAEVVLPAGLGFGARYVIGLNNVVEDQPDVDETWKNRTFQVYVFYRIFGGDN
ncbi:MAG TPA: porin family protein [Chryseolinea sp.]